MIPKKIHYCWLSNDPFPKKIRKCMDTWQKTHPDYEIIRWSTQNFDIDSVPYVKEAYEALVKSGIEEICLVLGSEEERIKYKDFFETPLPEEHLRKLSPEMQEYENRILGIGKRLHYVYQKEKRGFGHAVYQAADFASKEPVLLLLGDTIYRSETGKPCALQLIEQYEQYNRLMVSIHAVPLSDVSHYGILTGIWEDRNETVLDIAQMCEKP